MSRYEERKRNIRAPGTDPWLAESEMAAIEKAINDFFNSGSLKAAVYRGNAIFGFSSKVQQSFKIPCRSNVQYSS